MKKKYLLFLLLIICLYIPNVYAACPLGPETTKDISGVLKIFRIAAPLLMLGFTIFDLVKMLASGFSGGKEAPPAKQVGSRFVKRLVAVLIIFIIPTTINIVFQMAGVWNEEGTCDIANPESNSYEEPFFMGVVDPTTNKRPYMTRRTTRAKASDSGESGGSSGESSGGESGGSSGGESGGSSGGDENKYINPYTSNDFRVDYVKKAIDIANDDTVGYKSVVNQNLKNPNVDCGSFITFALREAGYNIKGIFEPSNKKPLTDAGFVCKKFTSVNFLQEGDIVGTSSGHHVELYLGNKKLVGAHHDYGNPEDGDQNGKEVSVGNWYDNKWEYYCRKS